MMRSLFAATVRCTKSPSIVILFFLFVHIATFLVEITSVLIAGIGSFVASMMVLVVDIFASFFLFISWSTASLALSLSN